MPLKLVLGPANSAKAGEVLGAFAAVAPRGAVLVVPTGSDVRHYRRELAETGAVLGAVLTFSGLAAEIARRARYFGRSLSHAQREEVLRLALADTRLDTLAPVARRPGFRRAAGEFVTELERSLVAPERFQAALRTWGSEVPGLARYAGDLGRIYERYRAELDRLDRVDADLFTWRALDALRAAPERWGRDSAFFYGFDDLTPLQRDAIETLARVVGVQVTVSLNFEAGRSAFAARAPAVAELRPLTDEILELPPRDDYYELSARPVLHHLERSLFEDGTSRVDPGSAVCLLESGGLRAEAELVAAEVLALLREGVAPEEVAVVYRSVSRAAPVLEEVFAQFGIPVGAAREVPFTHTSLGRALRGAARCALLPDEAKATDLFDYLRAPGILDGLPVIDTLEAELRREGRGSAAAARRRLGSPLPELAALETAADPGHELGQLAGHIFTAPFRGRAPLLEDAEAIDARALVLLTNTLRELGELGRAPRGRELLDLLDELTLPAAAPTGEGEVVVAEPLQIRARRFRVVFVCGLQEGEFPLPARPDPFLSDERRRELATSSGLRLTLHEDVIDRERYLFYTTVSRASERVFLSYRSSDEEGNLALPSPFLGDVATVLSPTFMERRRRRLLADVVWSPETAPTPRERAKALSAASAPVTGGDQAPERRLGALALSRLRHTRILSAGALETYGDCAVRWLIERELRPQPMEPEPEPVARGNLMHAVLERLLAELDEPLSPDTLSQAEMTLTSLMSELAPGVGARLGAGAPEVVRAGLLRGIEADLRRYLEHEASSGPGWRPFGVELRFGFEDDDARPSLPALKLGSGPDEVLMRGMIDRIDVDGGGRALIRDYKSGGPRPEYPAARWASDRRLQIALYLTAVRELTELEPVAGFYQPLRGDDLRGRGIFVSGLALGADVVDKDGRSPEDFAAELDAAAERAVTLTAALRAGELTPCPQTCSRDGCAYPGICRSQ